MPCSDGYPTDEQSEINALSVQLCATLKYLSKNQIIEASNNCGYDIRRWYLNHLITDNQLNARTEEEREIAKKEIVRIL